MTNNPHDHFTAFCNSLRKEGGKHSGKTKVVAIAYDGDMSVTMESMGDTRQDLAWRDMLRIVVNRYLDAWAGDDFDRERALSSLEDDLARIVTDYRKEYNMDEEDEE